MKEEFKRFLDDKYYKECAYGASSNKWEKIIDEFFDQYQPERLNPETCDHSGINIMQELDLQSNKCLKCGTIFTRCDSLNSMVT